MPPKVAVVLFNLGGPDSPAAIKPFLLNLFRDPAILRSHLGTRYVGSYALVTSQGIVLIDALDNWDEAKTNIEGMRGEIDKFITDEMRERSLGSLKTKWIDQL